MKKYLQRIRQSLSLRLSISVLLMAFVIFLASLGILFVESRRHIRQESTEHATNVLTAVSQRVERSLSLVENATKSTDWLVVQNFHPDSLLAYSRRIVLLNSAVDGCSITAEPNMFPSYGRYFSAYTVRESDTIVTVREGEYNYYEKAWYKTPKELGRDCWIDPFDDFNEGTLSAEEMIASYCKPLYDEQGNMLGVISSDLSLPKLSAAIDVEKPYPNAYFMLLGEKGQFFVHPDTTLLVNKTVFEIAKVEDRPEIVALGQRMIQGREGNMHVVMGGKHHIVCYKPVKGTKWSLALVCPEYDIFRSYYQLINIVIGLILMGFVAIFLFSRNIVAQSIRPLSRLVQQSQHIAEGHYDEVIPHSRRIDAVGRLQNSFATMQESLHRHVAEIQQINEGRILRNEQLHNARIQMEEANRQKTVFMQNVTHQIRTPLNIILGFAQLLRDSNNQLPVEDTRNGKDMMTKNVLTLKRMVLMLYDSSELGQNEELVNLHREKVSCNEVAFEGIEATHLHFPGLPIVFESSLPDDFCIQTDRLYLMRSLRELLYNSAKYSDGQHISVQVSATDTHVRFVYSDTGPGIKEEYADKMYEFFTKVDDLSQGLGLGLPLSKRHICHLGGDLILDKDYHEGCRFIVELPIS